MFLHLRNLYTLNILSLSNKGYSPDLSAHFFDVRYPPVIRDLKKFQIHCRANRPAKFNEP